MMMPKTDSLEDIQASIHSLADNVDLVKKNRRFIMKEELYRLKKSGQSKNPYCVYLFNDMILFAEKISKKSGALKYVSHLNMKDILFIDVTDSKEKYAFGIMNKNQKKKLKFAAKNEFARSTWKQTIEKQIEKHTPTDTTFDGGELMVTMGSPRNSWSESYSSELFGSFSSQSELSEEDRSADGDSPPNDPLLGKDGDWSNTSDNEESCAEELSDDTRSDSDESECEAKLVPISDGNTLIQHANLHTILWWLINYGDYNEPILIKTFLHSCTTFTTAPVLFQNLMEIYDLINPVPKAITLRFSLCDTRKRVHRFMKIWLEFFFDRDFLPDKALYARLVDFFDEIKELSKDNSDFFRDVNILKLVVIRVNKKRLVNKRITRFNTDSTQASPSQKLSNKSKNGQQVTVLLNAPSSGPSHETKLLDWNLTAVAEQFVLIEFALFKAVELKEITNMAWKSEQPRKNALNVINIFNRFDVVSQWAATEVVMAQSPKQRVTIIEKLIALAQKCLELRNYNSLMEIIAGLNRGSVQRMKKTWEAVAHTSRENFKALNMVVDSLQNYKNYREQLRKSILPCLPYFGIFLRDLTFTDVGNPAKIGDNINFEKIYMTSRILKEIQMFQRTPYSFDEDENLQPLLRRLLAMPEEMLYKHSQTIEPSMLSLSC